MREYFKSLPDQSTPLTGERLNGIFNGEEAIEKLVVGDIECKNLFNINNLTLATGSVDYSTGVITVNQYANGSTNTLKEIAPSLVAGETYTLSLVTTASSNQYIYLAGTSKSWRNGRNYTITQADLDAGIVFYGEYESNETYYISNIQIEKGTVATEYTPYKKFGYDSVNSMGKIVVDDISCKNLLPIAEIESITLSRNYYFDKPLPIGTYNLSVENIVSGGTAGSYVCVFRNGLSEGQYVYLRDDLYSVPFTTEEEYTYVTIYSQNGWSASREITTTFTKMMLNKGKSKLSYAPHKEFDNTCKLMGNFASASDGFTILSQVIFKQGNRYFGNLVVKKDSGNFGSTNESVATLPVGCVAGANTGCFLATSQWNVKGLGYLYVSNENNLTHFIVSDFASSNCNIAKINFDVVLKG